MDSLRDTQLEQFARLLDTPHANPFGANRSAERAYRRAERIVAALFLLTNHLPEADSLKRKIRVVAINLLASILDLRDEMRSPSSRRMIECQSGTRQLISLVNMLAVAGSISLQNGEVATIALDDFASFLAASSRSPLSDPLAFSKEDFLDVRDDHKGQSRTVKDKILIKDNGNVKVTSVTAHDSAISPRAQAILSILRTGGELTIRDIAAQLPEYGEKTIQRELGRLIEGGIIQRNGLKRWSRYAAATPRPALSGAGAQQPS